MKDEMVIKVSDVSMKFNLSEEKIYSAKEYFVKFVSKKLKFTEFWALKNVSFEINKGEIFGILGLNGAGKSTLLKIIAGVLKPTNGTVTVNGIMAPLIELGAGFDMELTGRENIFLNGAVLGFERNFIKDKFDEIVEFSELHDFLDVPVKNYSSGMIARLGFSIATVFNPEVLIVDEILSVGDYLFQEKSKKRMEEMINSDTTIVLVTHSIDQIKQICDNAIWLDKGKMVMIGNAFDVADAYINDKKMLGDNSVE